MKAAAIPEDAPRVPMTRFKLNPGAFARSGAIVTVHNKPRMVVSPIDAHAQKRPLDAIKAQLALVYRLQDAEDTADELSRLSQSRDQDIVGEPR